MLLPYIFINPIDVDIEKLLCTRIFSCHGVSIKKGNHHLYFFICFILFIFLYTAKETINKMVVYTHQGIHVNPNSQFITPSPPPPSAAFPPWCPYVFFSTSVSQFLPCKPVHLYHFLGSTYIH